MTLTLDLNADLTRALEETAKKSGQEPEALALEVLRERFAPTQPKRLVDLLAGEIGVLDSSEHVPGGARMSEHCGEKFTEGLLAQHRRESR